MDYGLRWVHGVEGTRAPAGDLAIIATDFHVWETWELYKLRWTIESTFGSQKSRGFDLERTGVTDPTRLERLFGLVTLAWLACLRVGVWRHEAKPIRVLAHGRRTMSPSPRLGIIAPRAAVCPRENERDPTGPDISFPRTGTAGN